MNATYSQFLSSDALDADVASRIVNLLWQRGGPWLADIDVQFHLGTATLSGTVRTYHERQLCTSCCRHVPGVRRVMDELRVEYTSPAPLQTS